MIDLRSDTVTKPGKAMLDAMMQAEVGDDVFGEDTTTVLLESKLADLFGKEAGLFVPSGTMANQIALKLHSQPMDEVICAYDAHIFQYEGAGYAFHSQIAINPLTTEDGLLSGSQVKAAIKPSQDWLPRTRIVSIENSSNRTGGNIYTLPQMQELYEISKEHKLKLHIDGARIFNAIIAGGYSPREVGSNCDSISICLSKGLGAPIGSVLLADAEEIHQARRIRKVMGGGMRQTGVITAAGLYALEYNIDRLAEDHHRAMDLKNCLQELNFVASIQPVETNIVIFHLREEETADSFIQRLEKKGVRASKFGPQTVRMVTHLDISDSDIKTVKRSLQNL